MPLSDKLDYFTAVIAADAKAECDLLLEEIRREKESTLTAAEDETLNEAFQYIKSEIARIQVESGRAISKKIMENKRVLFHMRETMLTELLEDAQVKLRDFAQTPAYGQLLIDELSRALPAFADAPAVIHLRPADSHLIPALREALATFKPTFAEASFQWGGFLLSCPEKARQLEIGRAHV